MHFHNSAYVFFTPHHCAHSTLHHTTPHHYTYSIHTTTLNTYFSHHTTSQHCTPYHFITHFHTTPHQCTHYWHHNTAYTFFITPHHFIHVPHTPQHCTHSPHHITTCTFFTQHYVTTQKLCTPYTKYTPFASHHLRNFTKIKFSVIERNYEEGLWRRRFWGEGGGETIALLISLSFSFLK